MKSSVTNGPDSNVGSHSNLNVEPVVTRESGTELPDPSRHEGINFDRDPTSCADTSTINESIADVYTSKIDRYGFFTGGDHDGPPISLSVVAERKIIEQRRTRKWLQMVRYWGSEHVLIRTKKMKKRIRKGIPDCLRGYMWYHLSDARHSKMRFRDLHLIDISIVSERTLDEIERDIDRTFPRHEVFCVESGHGQNALRRLLRLYAALDPEVGYCQGMGFIAGMFLTYMNEDDAFYCFHAALTSATAPLRLLYLPKMIETQKVLYVFEKLGALHLGGLWEHLCKEGLHPSMYATEWLMTMFCRGFAFDVVTRVWDVLLSEGNVKIMYRVGLAMLKYFEKEFREESFEEIMALVRNIPRRIDSEAVMKIAWGIPLKSSQIKKYEDEFNSERGEREVRKGCAV